MKNTAEIGRFKVISQSAIAAGVRRVEALRDVQLGNYLHEKEKNINLSTQIDKSNIKNLTDEIKKLKGDLQSRDREAVNLRKRVEVEKFKNELDQVSNKAKAAGTVYEKRLDDSLSTVKTQIKDAANKTSSPSSGGKRGSKKEKK